MKATIPYIKIDIPGWVVFRALGVISDRGILEHMPRHARYPDAGDTQALYQRWFRYPRPGGEPHFALILIFSYSVLLGCLDFIGNRGTTTGLNREHRLRYAQEILQKETPLHRNLG